MTIGRGRIEITWQVQGLDLKYLVGVVLRTSGGGVATWQAFWRKGLVKQKCDLNWGPKRGWETESFHPNRGSSPESKHTCTLITDVIPDLGKNKFLLVKFLSLVLCDISLRQLTYTQRKCGRPKPLFLPALPHPSVSPKEVLVDKGRRFKSLLCYFYPIPVERICKLRYKQSKANCEFP